MYVRLVNKPGSQTWIAKSFSSFSLEEPAITASVEEGEVVLIVRRSDFDDQMEYLGIDADQINFVN